MAPRKRNIENEDESLIPDEDNTSKKKQKPTRNLGGGLRLFTDLVCKKLRTEGSISSNDIAERLMAENGGDIESVDDNIRRRCYDALNVLLAVGIARKEGKYIVYIGGKTQDVDKNEIEERIRILNEEIIKKRENVKQLILNTICLDRLILTNYQKQEKKNDTNTYSLPFLIISTASDTSVQVEMSKKQNEMLFTMNNPFDIHDSNEIIRQLGYDHITENEKKIMLDSSTLKYIPHDLLQEALDMCPLESSSCISNIQLPTLSQPTSISVAKSNISTSYSQPYTKVVSDKYSLNESTPLLTKKSFSQTLPNVPTFQERSQDIENTLSISNQTHTTNAALLLSATNDITKVSIEKNKMFTSKNDVVYVPTDKLINKQKDPSSEIHNIHNPIVSSQESSIYSNNNIKSIQTHSQTPNDNTQVHSSSETVPYLLSNTIPLTTLDSQYDTATSTTAINGNDQYKSPTKSPSKSPSKTQSNITNSNDLTKNSLINTKNTQEYPSLYTYEKITQPKEDSLSNSFLFASFSPSKHHQSSLINDSQQPSTPSDSITAVISSSQQH